MSSNDVYNPSFWCHSEEDRSPFELDFAQGQYQGIFPRLWLVHKGNLHLHANFPKSNGVYVSTKIELNYLTGRTSSILGRFHDHWLHHLENYYLKTRRCIAWLLLNQWLWEWFFSASFPTGKGYSTIFTCNWAPDLMNDWNLQPIGNQ